MRPNPVAALYERVPMRLLRLWRGDGRAHRPGRYLKLLRASPEVIRAYQERELRRLLIHAQSSVPHYTRLFERLGIDAQERTPWEVLAVLPPLDRPTVVAKRDTLRSTAVAEQHLEQAQSGGTTGASLSFFSTREDARDKNDMAAAMQQLAGWRTGMRTAYVWGAVRDLPVQPGDGLLQRTKARLMTRWFERNLMIAANILGEDEMDQALAQLRRFRPQAVQAYPGAMDLLARHAMARGARVRIPFITLTAEGVSPEQRRRISEAFEANVTSWYGAREHGWIAAECPSQHRLHINVAGHILEVGDAGQLLVTDLRSYAMPLIRYELGDLATLTSEACPCGDPRPLIDALQGRVQDTLRLPSGALLPGIVLDPRGLTRPLRGIVETQIVQCELETLDVYYVKGPEFDEEQLDWFRELLVKRTEGEVGLRFHAVERIQREANGKLRPTICKLDVG